jgi:bisphosphoglycerate-independent phosphoglycerate mutase (AlkP superfamily)
MSAAQVADRVIAAIDSGRYDFILVNFANGCAISSEGTHPIS